MNDEFPKICEEVLTENTLALYGLFNTTINGNWTRHVQDNIHAKQSSKSKNVYASKHSLIGNSICHKSSLCYNK